MKRKNSVIFRSRVHGAAAGTAISVDATELFRGDQPLAFSDHACDTG
jgi:hypothetical protein